MHICVCFMCLCVCTTPAILVISRGKKVLKKTTTKSSNSVVYTTLLPFVCCFFFFAAFISFLLWRDCCCHFPCCEEVRAPSLSQQFNYIICLFFSLTLFSAFCLLKTQLRVCYEKLLHIYINGVWHKTAKEGKKKKESEVAVAGFFFSPPLFSFFLSILHQHSTTLYLALH